MTTEVKGIAHAIDDYQAGRKPTWVSHPTAWDELPDTYRSAYQDEWLRMDINAG